MRIEVTQHHIDEGTREDPSSCAIALAIKDAARSVVGDSNLYAYVDPNDFAHEGIEVFSGDPWGYKGYLMVDEATAAELEVFVAQFDRAGRGTVSPWSFEGELSHLEEND